jgi:hypothetical protein
MPDKEYRRWIGWGILMLLVIVLWVAMVLRQWLVK